MPARKKKATIRMRNAFSGPGISIRSGDLVTDGLSEKEKAALCARNHAELVEGELPDWKEPPPIPPPISPKRRYFRASDGKELVDDGKGILVPKE